MATLTVTLTETLTLNNTEQGGTTTQSISGVNDTLKRILSVPTTEVNLYETHDTNVAGNKFDDDNVKYVRISNLDSTNFVSLRVSNASNDEFVYKLAAGESLLLYGHNETMNASEAAALTIGTGEASITDIGAKANTAVVDVELFIASA
tara:strand:+ start:7728 stop:8174 length:447 start_codon:yes stop_codon:yes gene_type:complete